MKRNWLILLIIFIFVIGCTTSLDNVFVAPSNYKAVLSVTNTELVGEVSKYTIYGKYFNLEGKINYSDDFDKIDLVLKSKKQEFEYPLIYEVNEDIIEVGVEKHSKPYTRTKKKN